MLVFPQGSELGPSFFCINIKDLLEMENASRWRTLSVGIPQGPVLGPSFFFTCTKDLLTCKGQFQETS